MATEFSEIINSAISRFSDYTYLTLETEDKDAVMEGFLTNAINNFAPFCTSDLSDIDKDNKQFTNTLSLEDINILSCSVAIEWLKAHTLSTESITNRLSTKDSTFHSSAQLLSSLTTLLENLQSELDKLIILYTYRNKK